MADEQQQEMDPTNALYLCIAIIAAVLYAVLMDGGKIEASFGYAPGVIGRIFLATFMTPGGFLGLKIGRWIRDAIVPDFVMTDSVGGLVKNRLFWAFVPQAIGLCIGAALTGGLFLKLLGWMFGE